MGEQHRNEERERGDRSALFESKFSIELDFFQTKKTVDVGTLTEPECLAPCDAGTEVHLSGIIWHESESGKLPFHNGGSYRHYTSFSLQ